MPGTTPPTSQLDWLSSTTAMIVLFWSRATRDLLKSFGWGIAALHLVNAATKLLFKRAEILAMLAAGRASTDIARTSRCTAPRPAASPSTPATIDRRSAYLDEKADSLMISIGCRAYCCATN